MVYTSIILGMPPPRRSRTPGERTWRISRCLIATIVDRADAETRILSVIREAINLNAMEETERAVHLLTPMLSEYPEEPAVHLDWTSEQRKRDEFPFLSGQGHLA
jgi:hypothetical protein